MQGLEPGGMIAVRHPEIPQHWLDEGIQVAAQNNRNEFVVAGNFDALATLESKLRTEEIPFNRLKTSHAFHSHMMKPMLGELRKILETLSFKSGNIPVLSSLTGRHWSQNSPNTEYWLRHSVEPVNFFKAVESCDRDLVFVEVGAGRVLSQLLKRFDSDIQTLPTLGKDNENSLHLMAHSTYQLGRHGLCDQKQIPFPIVKGSLPWGFPFKRQRCWIDVQSIENKSTEKLSGEIPMNLNRDFSREIAQKLEDISGIAISNSDYSRTFLELGLDSLFLTQAAVSLRKSFKVKVTFRMLSETYPSVNALAEYIGKESPNQSCYSCYSCYSCSSKARESCFHYADGSSVSNFFYTQL